MIVQFLKRFLAGVQPENSEGQVLNELVDKLNEVVDGVNTDSSALSVDDGSTTVAAVGTLSFVGGTVSGTTPNATVTIVGGGLSAPLFQSGSVIGADNGVDLTLSGGTASAGTYTGAGVIVSGGSADGTYGTGGNVSVFGGGAAYGGNVIIQGGAYSYGSGGYAHMIAGEIILTGNGVSRVESRFDYVVLSSKLGVIIGTDAGKTINVSNGLPTSGTVSGDFYQSSGVVKIKP